MKAALFFIDEQTRQAFSGLNSGKAEEKELFRELKTAFDAIALDAFCGIQVPKRLTPKSYSHYGIDNLWKYNFHKSWRLMYTVAGDGALSRGIGVLPLGVPPRGCIAFACALGVQPEMVKHCCSVSFQVRHSPTH